MGTYQHWKAGRDDPSEVSRTYSGQFFDVCRELGAKGYAITTRSDRARLVDGDFVIENRPVRGLKDGGLRYHLGQLSYGLRLTLTALRRRADVAVISTGTHWFALSAMALLGVKVVPALHCALWPAGRPPSGRIARSIAKLDGWFWRHFAAATICVSPECERQVRQIAGTVRGPMYQVRAQYRRGYLDALPPAMWPDQQPFCVLYAGRIERVKGVFDLLEVAKQLEAKHPRRFRWEICGSGPAQAELAAAAKDAALDQNFILRGKLDRAAMADAFSRAHAVVVPTTAQFAEGLNKVCVESILAGRPVITSIHSNALDVLGNAAVEVPSGNVGAYADALIRLANDREVYESASRACAAVQEQFYDPARSWGTALLQILRTAI